MYVLGIILGVSVAYLLSYYILALIAKVGIKIQAQGGSILSHFFQALLAFFGIGLLQCKPEKVPEEESIRSLLTQPRRWLHFCQLSCAAQVILLIVVNMV